MQGEGYFVTDPHVTDNKYIGFCIENGICKIITKTHPRVSLDDTDDMIYV